MSDPGPWWTTYFDPDFLRLYRPLLPASQTLSEVQALEELFADRAGGRLLDVGCGWGRHAIELARSGYRVTGLDRSRTLLAEARGLAEAAGVDVGWVAADMRELPFLGGFDLAVSLFSSLGYFLDDEEDRRVLAGIRGALEPGGKFVLETMHRDMVAREFASRDWWRTPEGDTVWVERHFDSVGGVSHETLRWRTAEGAEGEKRHTVRVRAASEWRDLLRAAGFDPLEWFGGWDLEPLDLVSERLIVLCAR